MPNCMLIHDLSITQRWVMAGKVGQKAINRTPGGHAMITQCIIFSSLLKLGYPALMPHLQPDEV